MKEIQSSSASAKEKEAGKLVLALQYAKLTAQSTYLLETKTLPDVDLSESLKLCQKAHPGKKCVKVEELDYKFGNAIKGYSVACNKYCKPSWTKQSYGCFMHLKKAGNFGHYLTHVIQREPWRFSVTTYPLQIESDTIREFTYQNSMLKKFNLPVINFTDQEWDQMLLEETEEQIKNETCPFKVVVHKKLG